MAPGVTTEIAIPTASTVIVLGSASLANETLKFTSISTVSSRPVTSVQTVTSAVTTALDITVGPGGQVIGTVPTSVSQPGLVPPVSSTPSSLVASVTSL